MNKIRQQLTAQWSKLSTAMQRGFLAFAAISLLAILFITFRVNSDYGILFNLSDPEDAGEVVAALDAAKIPYRLSGSGTTIEVKSNDINRARILLAQQRLPAGGSIDFRIYDNPSPGWTRSTEKVNFLRALQGELEKTINALEAVKSSRVHLTLPKRAAFQQDEVPPSASVNLRLVPGRTVSPANVAAVQHLVAAAVERLEVGQVVVVDTQGRMLSRKGYEEIAGPTLDYKRDLERNLELKVTRLLEPIVGLGGVEVSVQSEVDFSQIQTQEEFFDPEQLALRSENIEDEIQGGDLSAAGGVAGAPAAQPNAAPGTVNQSLGPDGSRRSAKSKNYEVNRTLVNTQGPRATLKKLTVSVLVNGNYIVPEEGGDAQYAPRSEEELKEFQTLVEHAVGYDTTRGDRIVVSSKQFLVRPAYLADIESTAKSNNIWIPIAIGAGVLILGGFAFWWFRMRNLQNAMQGQIIRLGSSVSDAQAALEGDLSTALVAEGEQEPPNAAFLALRDQILEVTEQDPERSAEVVRAWIHETEA